MSTQPNDSAGTTASDERFDFSKGLQQRTTIIGGLTKREFFAATVFPGLYAQLSNHDILLRMRSFCMEHKIDSDQFLAEAAVEAADALIAALNKETTHGQEKN